MQPLRNLGDFIRDQRNSSQISLRQLAQSAGVSNPYLSQIERGLRKPSADILQQIARALRISAEALYVQAGILDERISGAEVTEAVNADLTLSERQKQVLIEIYDSFRRENDGSPTAGRPTPAEPDRPAAPPAASKPAKAPAKKAPAAKAPAKKAAKAVAKAPAKSVAKAPAKAVAMKATVELPVEAIARPAAPSTPPTANPSTDPS